MALPGTSGFASKEAILVTAYERDKVLFWIAAGVAVADPALHDAAPGGGLFRPRPFRGSPGGERGAVGDVDATGGAGPAVHRLELGVRGHTDSGRRLPAHEAADQAGHFVTIVAQVALAVGALLGFLLYRNRSREPLQIGLLERKFYFDEIYDRLVKIGQDWLGYVLYAFDQLVIGGLLVTGSAKTASGNGLAVAPDPVGKPAGIWRGFRLGSGGHPPVFPASVPEDAKTREKTKMASILGPDDRSAPGWRIRHPGGSALAEHRAGVGFGESGGQPGLVFPVRPGGRSGITAICGAPADSGHARDQPRLSGWTG